MNTESGPVDDAMHHPQDRIPIDHPQDRLGCASYLFRFSGCFLILYLIMFTAIICAAIIGFLFFQR